MSSERVPVVLIVDDEEDIRMVLQARLDHAIDQLLAAVGSGSHISTPG